MQSSCSLSKRLALVHLLVILIQFILTRSVSSLNLTNAYLTHKCRINQKIYQSKSKYQKLLNSTIRDIAKDDFKTGFRHYNLEDPPDSATILFWCRGDSYGSNCRSCFNTAVVELRRRCNRDSVGTIWYDQCTLETSGVSRLPSKIDYKNLLSLHNAKNMIGDIKSANKNIIAFLHKLKSQVKGFQKNSKEPVNYAVGETKSGTSKVYAMVQCVQITELALCKDCLESSIRELSKCCNGKQGARVLSTVCNIRYELYPFLRTRKTF